MIGTNIWVGSVFQTTVVSPVVFKGELLVSRETLIKAGWGSACTKCVERV